MKKTTEGNWMLREPLDLKMTSACLDFFIQPSSVTWSDPCLPDMSTTLSDEANGNFSFSIFAMRSSPSVCVDRHLCTWPETITWGGRNEVRWAVKFSQLLLASQTDRLICGAWADKKCIYSITAKNPKSRDHSAWQAPFTSQHCANVASVLIMGRLLYPHQLLNKSCPQTTSSQ